MVNLIALKIVNRLSLLSVTIRETHVLLAHVELMTQTVNMSLTTARLLRKKVIVNKKFSEAFSE